MDAAQPKLNKFYTSFSLHQFVIRIPLVIFCPVGQIVYDYEFVYSALFYWKQFVKDFYQIIIIYICNLVARNTLFYRSILIRIYSNAIWCVVLFHLLEVYTRIIYFAFVIFCPLVALLSYRLLCVNLRNSSVCEDSRRGTEKKFVYVWVTTCGIFR